MISYKIVLTKSQNPRGRKPLDSADLAMFIHELGGADGERIDPWSVMLSLTTEEHLESAPFVELSRSHAVEFDADYWDYDKDEDGGFTAVDGFIRNKTLEMA